MVGTFGNDIPVSPKIKIWRINIGVSIEDDPRSRDCRHRGKHWSWSPYTMDERQLTINQIANCINLTREKIENILYNKVGITKVSARRGSLSSCIWSKSIKLISSQQNLTLFEVEKNGFLGLFLLNSKWILASSLLADYKETFHAVEKLFFSVPNKFKDVHLHGR